MSDANPGCRVRIRTLGLALAAVVLVGLVGFLLTRGDGVPLWNWGDSGERLLRRFVELKNAGDAKADDLLAPRPEVPAEPVPEAEADRLDAQFILHREYKVADVKRVSGSENRFVLALVGNCASEPLQVRYEEGVGRSQRVVVNPDVTVEVRDGKIHGLRVRLHHDS